MNQMILILQMILCAISDNFNAKSVHCIDFQETQDYTKDECELSMAQVMPINDFLIKSNFHIGPKRKIKISIIFLSLLFSFVISTHL